MDSEKLEVLLLHKHPKYLKQCCDLINDEWPRSETARMMSLQASCDLLPTSLILVDNGKVIGHSKLTPIPSIPESCFLETVVISKVLRGKKLGTFLMKKVEEYCKDILKLSMIHLSTKGQENFYAKLGYKLCPPVIIYGGYTPTIIEPSLPNNKKNNSVPKLSAPQNGVPSPPPPPPMPKSNATNFANLKTTKTYMMKYLN